MKIHDSAICCSSDLCGPNVNDRLVHRAALVKAPDKDEVTVERYNLSQQPDVYMTNAKVAENLNEQGPDAWPLTFIDNRLICSADYPSTDELVNSLGIDSSDSARGQPAADRKAAVNVDPVLKNEAAENLSRRTVLSPWMRLRNHQVE